MTSVDPRRSVGVKRFSRGCYKDHSGHGSAITDRTTHIVPPLSLALQSGRPSCGPIHSGERPRDIGSIRRLNGPFSSAHGSRPRSLGRGPKGGTVRHRPCDRWHRCPETPARRTSRSIGKISISRSNTGHHRSLCIVMNTQKSAATADAAFLSRRAHLFRRLRIGSATWVLAVCVVGSLVASQPASPAPRPIVAAGSSLRAANAVPSANIAPNPDFLSSCPALAQSSYCLGSELEAIDNARAQEGLSPISIKLSGWRRLTRPEQLFTIANLERTTRHLPPAVAMTAQLDRVAQVGAATSVDPTLEGWTLTGGKRATGWGSNWAGGIASLAANYYWMYDDGTGFNIDCTPSNTSGCWAHRKNILVAPSGSCGSPAVTPQFVMGAAVSTTARYVPSDAEILVQECGGPPSDVVFTWNQAERIIGSPHLRLAKKIHHHHSASARRGAPQNRNCGRVHSATGTNQRQVYTLTSLRTHGSISKHASRQHRTKFTPCQSLANTVSGSTTTGSTTTGSSTKRPTRRIH